ncbi:cobyric acid synthase [Spirochaetota bacterium]
MADRSAHACASPIHGGDIVALAAASGLPVSSLIDASANINPLGPPAWLDAAFNQGRRACENYPDPAYRELRAAASERLGVNPDSIVFGNGADELMFALARSLFDATLKTRPVAIIEAPSYDSYRSASAAAGFSLRSIQARLPRAMGEVADERQSGDGLASYKAYEAALTMAPSGSLLWLGAPNNPTGIMPGDYPSCAASLAERFPEQYILCDEAFMDFYAGSELENEESARSIHGAAHDAVRLANLVVLRSMTKFWAVPGLRAGYALCHPSLASGLHAALPNWPLNTVAEAFARLAFCDPEADARRKQSIDFCVTERARMAGALSSLPGLRVFESGVNFYLINLGSDARAMTAASYLARLGIGVRSCRNFDGLAPGFLRIAVKKAAENDAIAEAIASALADEGHEQADRPNLEQSKRRSQHGVQRRAKALMIQGCSSNAGKSLIAAAFCRIFRDEGLDVAPYKAQNMSLNSAVTAAGLEIGRAQAVQAAACGLEADERMNPVLLKPESDRGSQIVLLGRPLARRQARDYYVMHEQMRDSARTAYDSLASEHELIVLEGAGSPAEINLKSHDFVNMAAARYAGARVLLVGDIDRGGVFASFIGHVATFAPDELRMLSGFIVNKFRGDPSLLGDAFSMTRERTGYPVLGCVPMIAGLDIPDEDEPLIKAGARAGTELRIAVPRLRRVSNFTDLDAFACEPDVEVLAVSLGTELDEGHFDAVIIPGTKSTVADLLWLKESGLADAILRFAAGGGTVVGICGGYQMLGQALLDPDGVESNARETPGLGLLPLLTSFDGDKTLSRVSARWVGTTNIPADNSLDGYEIHHGLTRLKDGPPGEAPGEAGLRPVILGDNGLVLGYGSEAVWGSYLHGIFDSDGFRRAFLNRLRARRGLAPLAPSMRRSLDSELSRLATIVKENVDMATIRMELGL